ncbi:MAG: hypothetical protein NVS9B14_00910 [Candidatus Acidiferrum sp.]
MLLALRNRLASLMLAAALLGAFIPSSSESQSLRLAAARDASRSAPSADPARTALLALGSDGQAIFQARAEVLSLLSQTNACSAWFLSAEPQAAEKFRSMDFALDPSGSGEIIQFVSWREQSGYYQPYVAKTGQNVGWGSTITLNANGAFFKTNARVRILGVAGDPGRLTASRPLAIGPFSAATLPARILATLHEFGHTVDLLPVDGDSFQEEAVSRHRFAASHSVGFCSQDI